MDILEIAAKGRKIIRVNETDYVLAFPLSIVAELEETLGRDMKSAADWLRIQTKEVPAILSAGLMNHHGEDEAKRVAAEICEALDPEQIEHVIEALCEAACPKALERVRKAIAEAQANIKAGIPNVQGAGVN